MLKYRFSILLLFISYAVPAQQGLHIGFQVGASRNSILIPSDFKSDYFAYRGISKACVSAYLEYGINDQFAFKLMVHNNQYGFQASTKRSEITQIGNTKYFSGGTEEIYSGSLSYSLEGKHRLNLLRERVFLTQSLGISWMNTGSSYAEKSDGPTVGLMSGSYSQGTLYSPINISLFSICTGIGFEFRVLKNKYITLDFRYSSGLKEIAHTNNSIHDPDTTYNLRIGNNGTFAAVTVGVKIPIIIYKKKIDTTSIINEEISYYEPAAEKEKISKIEKKVETRRNYFLTGVSLRRFSSEHPLAFLPAFNSFLPYFNIGVSARVYYFPYTKLAIGLVSEFSHRNEKTEKNTVLKNTVLIGGPSVRYYLLKSSSTIFLVTTVSAGFYYLKHKYREMKIESGIGFQQRIGYKFSFETNATIFKSIFDDTGYNVYAGLNYYLSKK